VVSTAKFPSIAITIFWQIKRFRKKERAYYIYRSMPKRNKIAAGKRRPGLLVLLLLLATFAGAQSPKYVARYRHLADSLASEFEIPATVILGVAIMESGGGTSRNCKLLNNHFGIVGKNDLWKTKKIRSRYKQYPDATASYVDFCKKIKKKKYYKHLKGKTDYNLWLDAMSKSGYSEAPAVWKSRVISVIKKNKLAAKR
jgi:flagellum-specific peptidoglycan hydrolase FlgJ